MAADGPGARRAGSDDGLDGSGRQFLAPLKAGRCEGLQFLLLAASTIAAPLVLAVLSSAPGHCNASRVSRYARWPRWPSRTVWVIGGRSQRARSSLASATIWSGCGLPVTWTAAA